MILTKESYCLQTIVALFFVYFSNIIYSQNTVAQINLTGNVIHKNKPVENAHIYNLNNKKNTLSNQNGIFNIIASVNDTIEIRPLAYEFEKIVVSQTNIKNKTLIIELEKKVTKLKEVAISSNGLSGDLEKDLLNIPFNVINPSEKLGIDIFEGEPKEKIPSVLGVFGFDKQALRNLEIVPTIQIEPLLKHINGYYKKLKDKRKFQTEEKLVDNLLYFYGANFFRDNYHIDESQIHNFLFFCTENNNTLISEFENKNHTQVIKIFEEKALIFNQN